MRLSQRLIRMLLLALVLGLAGFGQLQLLAEPPLVPLAVLCFLVAGLVLSGLQADAGGLYTQGRSRLHALYMAYPQAIQLLIGALGCGMLAIGVNPYPALRPWLPLALWAASLGLALASAAGFGAGQRLPRLEQRDWLALGGLLLLAGALRLTNLGEIPLNLGGDEGETGRQTRALLAGNLADPFSTGWLSHPMLWFYMQALVMRLVGDNVLGLRTLSALIGTLTIPVLYLFARPLYGRRVALLAGLLLAGSHFHIHFSRLALNNIVDPLTVLLGFTAFFYGYRQRAPLGFALAGTCFGLAQHFYMGARLAPLLLLLLLGHLLLVDRQRVLGLGPHLLLLVVCFMLAVGPLGVFFVGHPRDFSARLAMVGVFQSGWFAQQLANGRALSEIIGSQLAGAFGAFTYLNDRSAHYNPQIPLLDAASAALFGLGVASSLMRWRQPAQLLPLLWLAGTALLGGALLINVPEVPRYVIAAPMMALLVALALMRLGDAFQHTLQLPRGLVAALGAGVALALAAWNVNFYFTSYTPRAIYGWRNTEIATAIGSYLQANQPGAFVYFFGPPVMYFGNGSIGFLAPQTVGVDIKDPIKAPSDLPPAAVGKQPLFIFLPNRANELDLVRQGWPGGQTWRFMARSAPDELLFIAYKP